MLTLVCLPVALVCFVGILGVAYMSYDRFDHARVYVKGRENPTKKERKQLKRNWGRGGMCKAQDEQSEETIEIKTATQEEEGFMSVGQKMKRAVEKTKADLKKKTELKRIGNEMLESAVNTGKELLESTEAVLESQPTGSNYTVQHIIQSHVIGYKRLVYSSCRSLHQIQ